MSAVSPDALILRRARARIARIHPAINAVDALSSGVLLRWTKVWDRSAAGAPRIPPAAMGRSGSEAI